MPRIGELTASRIRAVRADAYRVQAGDADDGAALRHAPAVVVCEIDAEGQTGIGYAYAGARCAELLRGRIAGALLGRSALDVALAWHVVRAELGREVATPDAAAAASAADVALWDLKGKMLGASLLDLLGAVRSSAPIYGSGGGAACDVTRLRRQVARWVDEGLTRIKIQVGRRPEEDDARVAAARAEAGDDVELYVDADGAFGVAGAIEAARRFANEHGVRLFEEPRPSSDREGLARVRAAAPEGIWIAAGGDAPGPVDLRLLIEDGAVDCAQADATRCGGISGFLTAGYLCEAADVPLSTHGAPALHALLACAVEPVCHVERDHDLALAESRFLDGIAPIFEGRAVPNRGRPGHGLSLRGGLERLETLAVSRPASPPARRARA